MFASSLVALACDGGGPPVFDYPLDDQLRLQHVQSRGTHNSYHIAPDPFVLIDWDYTHSPLPEQLDAGMRQFELDLYIDAAGEGYDVFHIVNLDDGTTCARFDECLRQIKDWSDDHRAHHPIAVMLELKDPFDAETAAAALDLVDDVILSVWPEDRLVTPDLVRGDAADLRTAIAADGWPTLGELRGRALFWIHSGPEHRDVYTGGGVSLAGRAAFVRADADVPYAAVRVLDDPIADAAAIAEAVAANLLVRTRIDVLGEDGYAIDPARLDAALGSGAQFLSTDDESFTIPAGAPSRCNPATAPEICASEALEDPGQL